MSLATLPTLLLIPPLNCLTIAAAGAALRRPAILWTGLAGLAVFGMPIVSGALLAALRVDPPPGPAPQAIVVLSGDEQPIVENGRRTYEIGPATLEREAVAARLARRTGLPLLVSGGRVHPHTPSLADQMDESFARDFGLTVRWRETRSLDTWQNAVDSAAILHGAGIHAIYLVTHGWHMRRSLIAFRHAGLAVTAVPAADPAWPPLYAAAFVPSLRGWVESETAMHEWIGCLIYRIRAALT